MPRAATAKPDALQTVIVVIASRTYVEEFLGELQSQGFLPDRIETRGWTNCWRQRWPETASGFFHPHRAIRC